MLLRMIIVLTVVASAAAVAAGCAAPDAARNGDSKDGARSVVVAFYPLAWLAEQLGGRDVRVTNLTPAGSEPHELELSPTDLAAIHEADVVLYVGHGFQPAVEAALDGSDAVKVDVLGTRGLRLLQPNDSGDDHDDGGDAGEQLDVDPHVWLDPARFSLVAGSVGARLELDPRPVQAALAELDTAFRTALTDCERRTFITTHAAFGYIADAFDLQQVAITGVSPEAEPRPRDLQEVARQAAKTKATTVFFEPLVSPKLARQVARDVGAEAAVLDPIEGIATDRLDDGVDYLDVQRANARALQKALSCAGG